MTVHINKHYFKSPSLLSAVPGQVIPGSLKSRNKNNNYDVNISIMVTHKDRHKLKTDTGSNKSRINYSSTGHKQTTQSILNYITAVQKQTQAKANRSNITAVELSEAAW